MATAYAPEPEETLPDSGAMPDEELAAILDEHEKRAIGYYETEIASEQADALDRYYRRPYGDERAGRSKVVDATVAITVDNALAAILKPFASSEETVTFEPRSEEDEEQAQQATEYVNYVLHTDNDGFLIFHDWFKDALLQKLGVLKLYWEDQTREKIVRLEQLDALQIQELAEAAVAVYGPDDAGLYTADVSHTEPDGKLCIENIPPEEYRISPLARPGRVPPYEAHVTRKSRSELIEMGFDREIVMGLSKSSNGISDSRSIARYEDEQWATMQLDASGGEANEQVDFNDEFVLVDYDRDGISELRRVMRSGNVVLYNEEVEFGLFAKLCPVPMPHKVYGQSLADQVKDEQRIATVLWRQTLDNLYLANNPRPELPLAAERAGGETVDDLLSDAPGAIIRTNAPGMLNPFTIPFVADKSFPMLAYVEQQAESITGISKQGQGMDPDALDKSKQITATQSAIMEEGRNSRAEMIARIFAETGVKELFRKMLKLLVMHQPRERMIRLRNKWVQMDPRQWNAEMDVSISVGLGTGSKAQQLATSQAILEGMERIAQTPFGSIITKEHVYNGWKKFLNAAGVKNVDDFAQEPQRDEQGNIVPEQPQPDPKMMEVQAKLQMEQAKHEQQMQLKAAELEQQGQEAALKLQLSQQEMAAKIGLEREKAQAEILMNEQRMQAELQMKEREMQMREQLAERDAARRDYESDQKLKTNREGGSLAE